jgi:hypothetical protein
MKTAEATSANWKFRSCELLGSEASLRKDEVWPGPMLFGAVDPGMRFSFFILES